MPYAIIWSHSAEEELCKLEHGIAWRIYQKVGELSQNPFRNTIKLAGEPGYRLRVGDYGIIFDVQHAKLHILILKVGHRSSVYD